MIDRFSRLARDLRVSRPWTYKAPFLISVPYYVIAVTGMPFTTALAAFAASATTIIGVAGVGYLLNDLSDRDADAAAGKPNFVLAYSPAVVTALGLLFGVLAIAPWLFVLPLTPLTASLLVFEITLFAAYSLPPIRLKDRGALGALADALYAHANPALLAVLTFAFLAAAPVRDVLPYVVVVTIWQLASGLRNILLHQILDLENDLATASRTWVVDIGRERAEHLLRAVLVPAELATFAIFSVVVSMELPLFAGGMIASAAFTTWVIRVRWKRPLPRELRGFLFNYMDDFYVEWIPVIILLAAATEAPEFLALLVLHVAMFPKNAVLRVFTELRPRGT